MFMFRIGTYVLIFLSLIPGLMWGFTTWPIVAVVGAALFILLLYIVMKPHYYSIERAEKKIYVSSDKEGTDEFFLVFTDAEFQDYVIRKSLGGLRKKLFFLKKENGQFMLSKPLNVGLSGATHLKKIEELLSPLRKSHGVRL
jgi:hypothetical protein